MLIDVSAYIHKAKGYMGKGKVSRSPDASGAMVLASVNLLHTVLHLLK